MVIKRTKLKLSFWITLIVGITAAYFIWLTWNKLTDVIGSTNIVWGITGGIVLLAIVTGYFSIDKIVRRFV